MKLNKMELTALSSRIINELQDAADKEQHALNIIQNAKNLPQATRALKAAKTMNKILQGYLQGNSSKFEHISLKNILDFMCEKQTKITVPYRYCNSGGIFEKLVIAQIDCPDVNSIIEKVKTSFIKI